MRNGFTLIELLVVVTITVVLLALLTPAMDQAIYQAELTICATNLKATGSGVALYAMDHKRWYPYRSEIMGETRWNVRPSTLLVPNPSLSNPQAGPVSNLRQTIDGYITPNKMLNCPLNGKCDFDVPGSAAGHILASYNMWFGWRFIPANVPSKGMAKLGDRVEWQGKFFNVLAGDDDLMGPANNAVWGTHPDRADKMPLFVVQDGQITAGSSGPTSQATWAGHTFSRWYAWDTAADRGPIDTNYVFDDGSVRRYLNVRWNEYTYDGPITWVPVWATPSAGAPSEWLHIPLR